MKKVLNSAKAIPNKAMQDWTVNGIKKYYVLMLDFLRISPSYQLAKEIRVNNLDIASQKKLIYDLYQPPERLLTANEKSELIADFQTVLKNYDDLGDISSITFDRWWAERGVNIYGTPFLKPKVAQIARIEKTEEFELTFNKTYEHYLTNIRAHEGNPTSLVLGVPLGMPKAYLMRQISSMIDRAKVPLTSKSKQSSKPMAVKRLRYEPYAIQLRILMAKAEYPDLPLWKIGLLAKVSAKHAKTLDIEGSKKKFEVADTKEHLAILTSRAFKKSKQVAENAARGSFPNTKALTFMPNFDFDVINCQLKLHYKELKPRKTNKSVHREDI